MYSQLKMRIHEFTYIIQVIRKLRKTDSVSIQIPSLHLTSQFSSFQK